MKHFTFLIDLQRFADGAAAPSAQGGADGSSDAAQPSEDRSAAFEKLIQGEYKDLYDAKLQASLKSARDTVERYRQLAPTLALLGKKYGIAPNPDGGCDIAALHRAVEAEGKPDPHLRQNAERLYAQWMEQAEHTKSVYPAFNLQAELKNPRFAKLLRGNVDVRTAYEVLHKDEILPAAMQFTAKTVEQKLTNKLLAGGARPTENGNGAQSAIVTKRDVSQLTKADRREIIRRVQKGETIRF